MATLGATSNTTTFPTGSGTLEIKEIDGAPDVSNVTIIRVTNGTLTDDGGGQVTLSIGGGSNHDLLDGTVNQDTVAQVVSRGSLIYGNATPKWDELVVGAANSILTSDGTDVAWNTTPAMAGVQVNGRIAPTQLTADTDDYNPTNFHTTYELSISSNGPINLTGLDAGVQGELHLLLNDGVTHIITLKHATTSSSGNQFWLPNQADFSLHPRSSVVLMYDATATKWLVVGGSQETGSGGTVTTTGSPSSGNLTKFSGASSITNGDLSGDVTTSGTLATTIANSAVTLAKIANAAASSKLVGSGSSGSGAAYSEITLDASLTMTGTTLSTTASASGGLLQQVVDVTQAQINAGATPITMISAPGSGNMIQIVSCVIEKNLTAAFNSATLFTLRWIGDTQQLVSSVSLNLNSTTYQTYYAANTAGAHTSGFHPANKGVELVWNGNNTLGSNGLRFIILYQIIPILG